MAFLTLQTADSVTDTSSSPWNVKKEEIKQIKKRPSKRPKPDDLDAESHCGSAGWPAFISYLLLRILLRHCMHASMSDGSIAARADVGSV